MLDFVPNHVAPDHPWAPDQPELFVGGTDDDLRDDPKSFVRVGGRVLATGPRPLLPGLARRRAARRVRARPAGRRRRHAVGIAAQCDGVRCDMAMLMMNDAFARTWGDRAGPVPAAEYWTR